MRWLAKRFRYTKDLYNLSRFYKHQAEGLWVTNDMLRGLLSEAWPQMTKLTYEESHEILSACVDYHEALLSLNAADPIQDRVFSIFTKYGIKIKRNTLGDVHARRDKYNAVIKGVTG